MRAQLQRSLVIAGTYFVYANIVFVLGVYRVIDVFVWGFLSYFSYWPFSRLTKEMWKIAITSLQPRYEVYIHILWFKLYVPYCIDYGLNVILGTLWWVAISYFALSIAHRLRASLGNVDTGTIDS
jgi:hypothetical protein